MTTVALVDDHILLRSSLARIITNFEGYFVLFQADNGQHFIDQITKKNTPDIVLLDISMPVMDGFETAKWIKNNLPDTKVLVLSMMDNDTTINSMLHFVNNSNNSLSNKSNQLTEKEREFIKFACTEMTYKEIALQMGTSARNIDMYRDQVFEKLEIKSRVGLVLYAIKKVIPKKNFN